MGHVMRTIVTMLTVMAVAGTTHAADAYLCQDPMGEKVCAPLAGEYVLLRLPAERACVAKYNADDTTAVAVCGTEEEAEVTVFAICDIPQSRLVMFKFHGAMLALICSGPADGEVSI